MDDEELKDAVISDFAIAFIREVEKLIEKNGKAFVMELVESTEWKLNVR